MDGGHPGGQGRDLAVPAALRRRRAPAADEAAQGRRVPDRIAPRLHRRLPPEPDQAVRLRRGRHRPRLAQPPRRGGRRDHEMAGQPAADRGVDAQSRTVSFDRPSLFALLSGDRPGPYWVENVVEALDTPGQWYLDRPQGILYYLPRPREEMRSAEIIAPRLTRLIRVVGRAGAPAHDLCFEGLTFAHAEWQPPA